MGMRHFSGHMPLIGNGFTLADKSPVHFYRADTVTDLSSEASVSTKRESIGPR